MATLAVVPPGDEVQRVPLGTMSDVPLRRHSVTRSIRFTLQI